ncbi:MAG TPA: aminoglycoside adenylyltransferase domain-containing protein [Gaiellaceae bacterium]|nr:aminoglycoside adenylyltransferase domain-containing protein [Gaiellaceae bacterium]
MTGFPELDELLVELVDEQRNILGDVFVGTYLHGSFALGAGDEWSDVDFLCVVERDPDAREQDALQAVHRRLFDRRAPWGRHLEGSYAPRAELRRTTGDRWFYFDHGSTTPVWDAHCNKALVRWTLREHGIVLDGPPLSELVEPVAADELRAEARAALAEYAQWAHEPMEQAPSGMNWWKQTYVVLTLCRVLWTVRHGTIVSKDEAASWAARELPGWADLVQRAVAERPDPVKRWWSDSTRELVERTRAFADHVAALE